MRKILVVLGAVMMISAATSKTASADIICDDYGCYDDGFGDFVIDGDVTSAKEAAMN